MVLDRFNNKKKRKKGSLVKVMDRNPIKMNKGNNRQRKRISSYHEQLMETKWSCNDI